MIEILFMAVIATKQPSCPPPPPPPERIVTVIPRELKLVIVKEKRELKGVKEVAVIPRELELVPVNTERKFKDGKENVANPLVRKMAKIPQAKRQFNRRGVRNK